MYAECTIGAFDALEKGGPKGNGIDGFGVEWVNYIPRPGRFILTDITKWKKELTFPDVNSVDWAAKYENDLKRIQKDEKYFVYASCNGPFERLASLMGFEGALISMFEEPEATRELFEAIVDNKIEMAKKVMQHYKTAPDAWENFDDVATARSLFMSRKMYEELIMPPTQRYYDEIRALGLDVKNHVCGHCEDLIEDYIALGCKIISSIQPVNDIAGIIQKYGDRITIEGGFDSSGRPWGQASEAEVRAEIDRSLDEYAVFGRAFILGPAAIASIENITSPENTRLMNIANDEYIKYGAKFHKY
jgi:uroporphyrinogen-III decarboxylase